MMNLAGGESESHESHHCPADPVVHERPNESGFEAGDANRRSSSNLLRLVLESTLSKGDQGLSDDEWLAIRSVAEDPDHENVPLDQIAPKLVTALLDCRFPGIAQQGEAAQISIRIAECLCGDPHATQNLRRFWMQLKGVAQ